MVKKKNHKKIICRDVQYSFCKDHSSLRRRGFSEAIILKHLPAPRSESAGSCVHQEGNVQAHICHD